MARRKQRKDGAGGELLQNAEEDEIIEQRWRIVGDGKPPKRPSKKYRYVDELVRLQFELIKLQEWVRLQGLKVVVIFEGRDAAARAASSSGSARASTRASAASWRSARRPRRSADNGTFNATSPICRRAAR